MAKVFCSHCGEELLGSVNRCWRCGRQFVAEYNPENDPPVRRSPIPLELVNKSEEELRQLALERHASAARAKAVASKAVPEDGVASDAASDVSAAVYVAALANSSESAPVSTTAAVVTTAVPATTTLADAKRSPPGGRTSAPYYTAPHAPRYPQNAGAVGGAIAAVVLGVMALVTLRLLAPAALLISIIGVGLGVWGLQSERRGAAVFGLLLCCIAMALSGFYTAVQLFELVNGYSPFEGDLSPADLVEPAEF